jgi:leucyl aminopeptidase
MKPIFTDYKQPDAGTLIILAAKGAKPGRAFAALDGAAKGSLTKALKSSGFNGKRNEHVLIPVPAGSKLERLIVIGIGKVEDFDAVAAEQAGGTAVAVCDANKIEAATILLDAVSGSKLDATDMAAHIGMGARLRSYKFHQYRTKMTAEQKQTLERLTIATVDAAAAKKKYARLDAIANGVYLTRDLVSEPPNVLYPETMAERAKKALEPLGVEVETLNVKQMTRLGMGALLAVGMGSTKPPVLLVMRYNGGGKKSQKPVAIIGKGITFDSGGISLKPGPGMEDMKWDMAGAGTVIGLMAALAGRKAKVDAVGVCALAENMPSGGAQRPGDIVRSMSGQTIEVHNTDAEGRLVLADALWYTQDRFKPAVMIDLATLTGAVLVALGHEFAGLFSNDDQLAADLTAAGKETGELLWRLPLTENFDKAINSDVADMKNIAGGRNAGSTIGGQFLQRFVNGVKWAHLDIAGMAWGKSDKPVTPKGATAYGVRLLDTYIAKHFEG